MSYDISDDLPDNLPDNLLRDFTPQGDFARAHRTTTRPSGDTGNRAYRGSCGTARFGSAPTPKHGTLFSAV